MDPRVLILHNRYRQSGGEERLVGQLKRLLDGRGIPCELLERESANVSRLEAGLALVRGGRRPEEVAQTVRAAGANIVHVHNMNPMFGARSLAAARRAGARVIVHVHNFRLFCAIATCFRDGEQCFRCHGRHTWPGVRYRCRGSAAEGAAYGVSLAAHQPLVFRSVDRFVTPSSFARRKLEELGLPRERTEVLPNPLGNEEFAERSRAHQGSYALYAGRLADEKGVETAVRAAERAAVPLIVAGEGPRAARIAGLAGGSRLVELVGHVDATRLGALRAGAALAVVPSRGPEVFPYAAVEAMAAGLPILASRVGGLPELLDERQLVPPGDERAWAGSLQALWKAPAERRAIGDANIARARDELNADLFADRLLGVYARVLGTSA